MKIRTAKLNSQIVKGSGVKYERRRKKTCNHYIKQKVKEFLYCYWLIV